MSSLSLSPIAVIRTPYKEKFAVPRQPDLVRDGTGIIELLPPYDCIEMVEGLEQFSHIWLIFQFNKIAAGKWQPRVRPPRLGGNRRIGVLASRATHRPNPLGLSKAELREIEFKDGKVRLYLGAVDLVDGTPIFDIKPYIAFADSQPDARSGFAAEKPSRPLSVEFSPVLEERLKKLEQKRPHFSRFIRDVISQDPRPAYRRNKADNHIYGILLHEFNIRWGIKPGTLNRAEILEIIEIAPCDSTKLPLG
ncbi:tRNA-Thr(GGU) m(6)t(6)A37 methyltransferase TsaA [Mesocricetibacter intestinalis]|uniref:tRNA-Thr(GGU) m(6)t(6)A37 methyltransferase TsaA n=1 Tax=Mesocricetibacter intestinalis TaxID=1521930 RepID=A0A4R6VC79_9PAST|nr:tRNA (N6-threonylcarbamoyladenosine(37)-N6)-methyltransferase TrmO [Mesocricetibacter intestinalis]TDQ58026.1 tRNA-Thr(GGU) m(6)t(6)A37 methyltransferase TsaA [Mesocricetibacter intestinalis]